MKNKLAWCHQSNPAYPVNLSSLPPGPCGLPSYNPEVAEDKAALRAVLALDHAIVFHTHFGWMVACDSVEGADTPTLMI